MMKHLSSLLLVIILIASSALLSYRGLTYIRGMLEPRIFRPFQRFKPFELGGRNATLVLLESGDVAWEDYSERLAREYYYNTGFLAWYVPAELKAYVNIYKITGERKWLDRAVIRADYLVNVSDVNGDGVPSWGNYNETWGGCPEYKWGEATVWDGVICTALMNLVKLIFTDPVLSENSTLLRKAETYLNLVTKVIDRYHQCWIQTGEGEGHYWVDPEGDTSPIFNQFLALGIAEILVYEVTGDEKYLEKPLAMARFMKRNLRLVEESDAYFWHYMVGGRLEDLGHGSIDIEFAVLAYKHRLAFNDTDMRRFAHGFTRLIWRGESGGYPYLNTYIDGSEVATKPDQRPTSWVRLAEFNSLVWLYCCITFNDRVERVGDVSDRDALLGASELFLYTPEPRRLAMDAIEEAENYLGKHPTSSIFNFRSVAENHLNSAVEAYNEGDYEEALYQARMCSEVSRGLTDIVRAGYLLITVNVFIWLLIVIIVILTRHGARVT